MNVKAISTNVGKALLVSALFMFLSIIVSLVNGRDSAFGPLTISFIITLITGYFPFIFVKSHTYIHLNTHSYIHTQRHSDLNLLVLKNKIFLNKCYEVTNMFLPHKK